MTDRRYSHESETAPLCECGCGHKVLLNRLGRPNRFLKGHALRGLPKTADHRAKLSKAAVGRPGYWKGKIVPADVRAKMSASAKLKRLTAEHRANIGKALLGGKASEAKLKKMRARRASPETIEKKRLCQLGDKGSNWKGGLSTLNERARASAAYRDWRNAVLDRDDRQCQHCGGSGELHAHHVKQFALYPVLRFEVANGQTLCFTCHEIEHGRLKMPAMNPDGISVKGCSYIYAPKGQAGEYSALAANPYRGCGNRCVYCYVPKVIKIDRGEFDKSATPRPNYINYLSADAKKYQRLGITEQVMFSFTTDVYNPFDTSLTRPAIEILRDHGLAFCTLTKGGSRALRDLDLFRADRDAFASTLTSVDDAFSAKWESGAAPASDRIATLRKFHEAGIFTWVSLEPTIDVEASLAVVDATHEFVDLYKVGRVNYLGITRTNDWQAYTLRMVDKLRRLGKAHYIKRDLQGFLPPDYHNPLRVPQHH